MSSSVFLNAFSQYGAQYAPDYASASQATGIPASVLAAQDYAESTFGTQVGNGGGIAQFEPATINNDLGSSIAAVQNPAVGIQEQAVYLAQLQQQYGSLPAALSAYNTGSPTSPVGQQYASGIMANAAALGNQNATTGQVSGVALLNEIPPPSATTLQQAAASAQKTACPSLSFTNPSPWLACEGMNLILMLLGIVGIIIALAMMFDVKPSDIAGAVSGGGGGGSSIADVAEVAAA